MNQHYVPRVYLKNFASKKGKEYFVDVYDKQEDRFFKTNIKNICAEVDFYTLDNETTVASNVMAVEKIYADHIEPMYAKAYALLTDESIYHLTDEQRTEIIISTMQFCLRNPAVLKNAIAEHTRLIRINCINAKNSNEKGITYLDEDYSFRDFTVEQIINDVVERATKYFKERHLVEYRKMSIFHADAKIEVTKVQGKSSFFACDNPFVANDVLSNYWNPMTRSSEFILPLNKKFLLKIFHDNNKELNRIYRYRVSGADGMINQALFDNCQRFVITDKESFQNHQKVQAWLNDTSDELKIDTLRKIAELIKDRDNIEGIKLVNDAMEKYERTGELTFEDQLEFMTKSNEMYSDTVRNRTK